MNRKQGMGKLIVKELMKKAGDASSLHLVTVIPEYFSQFGFQAVEDILRFLSEKNDECANKCHVEQPVAMRLTNV